MSHLSSFQQSIHTSHSIPEQQVKIQVHALMTVIAPLVWPQTAEYTDWFLTVVSFGSFNIPALLLVDFFMTNLAVKIQTGSGLRVQSWLKLLSRKTSHHCTCVLCALLDVFSLFSWSRRLQALFIHVDVFLRRQTLFE